MATPGHPLERETCGDCGKPMVRGLRAWRRLGPVREQWVLHKAHGLCERCADRRCDTPARRARQRLDKFDVDGTRLPRSIHRRGSTYTFKWREVSGKERHGSRASLADALAALAERRAEVAEQRAKMAQQRRAYRASRYKACLRAAQLKRERSAAEAEIALAEVQRQRERAQRAASKLRDSGNPSEKAIGESYALMRRLMQKVGAGAGAAEGLRAVRLRAAYESLREAEEAIIAAVFGNDTDQRGQFRDSA